MKVKILFIFIGLAFFVYWRLLGTFFLQDEWAIFGNFLYWEKAHLGWFTRLFVYEQDTHLIPLSNLLSYMMFKFFGVHFVPYAMVSIMLHALTGYLVFELVQIFTKRRAIAFLAGVFFLTNAATQQAITWVATTIGTVGSTIFAVLSVLYFYYHINSHRSISRYLIVSIGFFLASLTLKETSIFLLIFYPAFLLLFLKKGKAKGLISLCIVLGITVVLYASVRLVLSQFWGQTSATPAELSQPPFLVYVFRLITHPLRFLVQSFIPIPILLLIARKLVLLGYPQYVFNGTPEPHVVETVAIDIVTFAVSLLLTCCGLYLCRGFYKKRHSDVPNLIILSGLFIASASLPFVIIPGSAGYITLFDGRHLYMASIFAAAILSILFITFYKEILQRSLARLCVLVVVFFYFGYHTYAIWENLRSQHQVASVRQSILHTVLTDYPKLPSKVIFYIQSDTAYYGLPPEEKIVPFQSGFGQTLLVWYNAHGENFPACFFERKYLYPLMTEEYKECGGRGFGYYRNYKSLSEAMRRYNVGPESVITYKWTDRNKQLRDISIVTRDILKR